MRTDGVDNAPIREAVQGKIERGLLTVEEIAARCDWVLPNGTPDGRRVSRALGLTEEVCSAKRGGGRRRRSRVGVEIAAKILRAAHIDPVDVGL